jgi:acyl-CoA synthetase (NDP forming)
MKIIQEALKKGQKTLSEYESKKLLKAYGFPVVREELVESRAGAVKAAKAIGLPVVLKGCSAEIAHKTEKKLIEVDLRTLKEVQRAYDDIRERVGSTLLDGILVQEMVKGSRELVIGMIRDAQFGPCVTLWRWLRKSKELPCWELSGEWPLSIWTCWFPC